VVHARRAEPAESAATILATARLSRMSRVLNCWRDTMLLPVGRLADFVGLIWSSIAAISEDVNFFDMVASNTG
jgi:hypothetical protein